jgi:hypothetical protein
MTNKEYTKKYNEFIKLKKPIASIGKGALNDYYVNQDVNKYDELKRILREDKNNYSKLSDLEKIELN